MNKTEFINKVKQGLDNISKEEQENALRYYVEYFQDAGEENEEEVIKELGTPEEVVAKIKSEMSALEETNEKGEVKKTEPWIVVLLILASPFIFAGLAILASLILALFCVIFAFAISGFALIFAGIVCTVVSFMAIPTSFASFMFLLGVGLVSMAIGMFFGLLTYHMARLVANGTVSLCQKIWRGVKR